MKKQIHITIDKEVLRRVKEKLIKESKPGQTPNLSGLIEACLREYLEDRQGIA